MLVARVEPRGLKPHWERDDLTRVIRTIRDAHSSEPPPRKASGERAFQLPIGIGSRRHISWERWDFWRYVIIPGRGERIIFCHIPPQDSDGSIRREYAGFRRSAPLAWHVSSHTAHVTVSGLPDEIVVYLESMDCETAVRNVLFPTG
jgi:hypothetical protein